MKEEMLIQRMCKACYIDPNAYDGIASKTAKEILDHHSDFNIEEFEKLSLELDQAPANQEFYPKGTEASARIALTILCENLRIKPKLAHEDDITTIMNRYNFDWQWA